MNSLSDVLKVELPCLKEVQLCDKSLEKEIFSPSGAKIISKELKGGRFRRARLCKLEVPEKFYAETLVIYPQFCYDFPIFGAEYLAIGKNKFFGAVDFHPISKTTNYSSKYLSEFVGSEVKPSKFYDFSTFFSEKLWLQKSDSPELYEQFISISRSYLNRYRVCAEQSTSEFDSILFQIAYDSHMAENDPARGILKAYFSKEFAETYIRRFLFNLSQ